MGKLEFKMRELNSSLSSLASKRSPSTSLFLTCHRPLIPYTQFPSPYLCNREGEARLRSGKGVYEGRGVERGKPRDNENFAGGWRERGTERAKKG